MNEKMQSVGLLLLRLSLGLMVLYHAIPKIIAGPIAWKTAGLAISFLKIGLPLKVLGLLLLGIEILGGLSLLTGFFFGFMSLLMAVIFFLLSLNFIRIGYKSIASYTLVFAITCVSLRLIGPGNYIISLLKIEKKD
jgi:uncharacterized membrane protein YphA (DoxX/SURF4 family)